MVRYLSPRRGANFSKRSLGFFKTQDWALHFDSEMLILPRVFKGFHVLGMLLITFRSRIIDFPKVFQGFRSKSGSIFGTFGPIPGPAGLKNKEGFFARF